MVQHISEKILEREQTKRDKRLSRSSTVRIKMKRANYSNLISICKGKYNKMITYMSAKKYEHLAVMSLGFPLFEFHHQIITNIDVKTDMIDQEFITLYFEYGLLESITKRRDSIINALINVDELKNTNSLTLYNYLCGKSAIITDTHIDEKTKKILHAIY